VVTNPMHDGLSNTTVTAPRSRSSPAGISLADVLLLDHHGTDRVVENDETVTLHNGADLHSRPPQHITIHVNRPRFVLANPTQTCAALKALARVPLTDHALPVETRRRRD
jgi:hypothetical protein